MTRKKLAVRCALAAGLYCTAAALMAQAGPAVRITGPIDENRLVVLHGTVHPLANAANDRGAAPDAMPLDRLQLVLKRSPAQETALRALLAEMHSPGSPHYHKWLTPEQFGAQFGPSDQDVATVEKWLTGQGFRVIRVNPGKETLEIAGNVAQMRSAFHAQIHRYEVNGETHYANANDPQIPAALAPVLGGFFSLNNFRPKRFLQALGKAQYDPRSGLAQPEWTIGPGSSAYAENYVLTPADFAVQYDLNPLYGKGITGAGQTIAIVNESNVNLDLVNQFRSVFLPGSPLNQTQVIIDGGDPGVDGINNFDGLNYASTEAYLDVEWAGAVAPDATIDLVIAADTALEDGLDLAAGYAVYSNLAPVMSLSFGQCEAFLEARNQAIEDLWEQAAAQGITVVVSTGDSGSAGCDGSGQEYSVVGQNVNGYASTPFNVAVGGTDFYYSSFAQSESAIDAQLAQYWNTTPANGAPGLSINAAAAPIPEQAWNDSQYGDNIVSFYNQIAGQQGTIIAAGGGGASNSAVCAGNTYGTNGQCSGAVSGYPKPAWQQALVGVAGSGMPNDKVRDLPDVSLFAANGLNDSYYPECAADGDCQAAAGGGTVQFSGVGGTSASTPAFAGILALVNQATGGRQGQADSILYPLSQQFPAAFHDVTAGTIAVPCEYAPSDVPGCIAVSNPITLSTGATSSVTEGEIGSGSTPEYNAGAGYDLATGLGSIDANTLVTDWNQVKFATTATTLTPSSTTFTHGTAINITGNVSGAGTPSGDVALMTDSTEEANQGQVFFTLNNGSFTSAANYPNGINFLPGGTYHVWGQYGGDAENATSSSTPVEITVNPEPSAIDLNMVAYGLSAIYQPGAGPSTSLPYGTELLLSAAVAPSSQAAALEACLVNNVGCASLLYQNPTGVVTFTDSISGGGVSSSTPLNTAGEAEWNAPYAVGSHSVTASYDGDPSYGSAATTLPIAFTVAPDSPAVLYGFSTLGSTANPVNGIGQPTVITFLFENSAEFRGGFGGVPVPVASPTGTVTLSSTPAGLAGTAQLSPTVDPYSRAASSVVTFTFPPGSLSGTYTPSLSYSGDSNYAGFQNLGSASPFVISNLNSNGLGSSSTTAALSGTVTPNSNVIITGSVTGSGSAAPTGGVEIYSSGILLPYLFAFSSSNGNVSNFSAVLNHQILVQGANFITVQFPGDSNYNPSAIVLSATVENPVNDFTMVPDAPIVIVPEGGSGAATIQLGSLNGFSGEIDLSCVAATVTCSVTPSANLSSGGSGTATLTVNAASGTADGTYNVMVTGKDAATGETIHTLGLQADVGAFVIAGTFRLAATSPSSIAPGATATSTITVTGSNYAGAVSLACSLTSSPSGAADLPSCAVTSGSPVALSAGTATGTATITVTTTAAASGALVRPGAAHGGGLAGALGGALLALLVFLGVPARRGSWRAMLGALAVVLALASVTSCGGSLNSSGGGGGGGGSSGTTAGAYTFTVTGTGNPAADPAPPPVTFIVTVN